MSEKAINMEKEIGLIWYCYITGTSINYIDDVFYDEKTHEVTIKVMDETAVVKVDNYSVNIFSYSERDVKCSTFRTDKAIFLTKNENTVYWMESFIERTKIGLNKLFIDESRFVPIDNIFTAVQLYDSLKILGIPMNEYAKINFTYKDLEVDRSFNFRDCITSFKSVRDYAFDDRSCIKIRK